MGLGDRVSLAVLAALVVLSGIGTPLASGGSVATGPDEALAGGQGGPSTSASPATAAGAGTGATAGQVGIGPLPDGASGADAIEDINVTREFRLTPSRPGEVTVRLRFVVPDRVDYFEVSLVENATATNVSDFRETEPGTYVWGERTIAPTLSYRLPVNRSLSSSVVDGDDDAVVAADVGEWALFRTPRTRMNWTVERPALDFSLRSVTAVDPVEMTRTDAVAGPGVVGENVVFLGEHEVRERRAHGQRFRLVVPAAANLTDRPAEVLDSLSHAAGALEVGQRDDRVTVFTAPTGQVDWAVKGYQFGDSDVVVRADQTVNAADNAWIHEYVHTRQRTGDKRLLSRDLLWFHEAVPTYYAALLTFEQGRIDYEAFRDRLASGEDAVYDDVVLTNASTWTGSPSYQRGPLVVANLDRRLRLATDGERGLAALVAEINADLGPTSVREFFARLREIGGPDAAEAARADVASPANVSTWNASAHETAYGSLPARIDYGLPEPDRAGAYRTTGPYRQADLRGERPLELVSGERLAISVPVDNAGGSDGTFAVPLRVNGTVVDTDRGTVAPGETATATVRHTFEEPGRYRLSVDGTARTVTVTPPPDVTVASFGLRQSKAMQGDTAAAVVRLRNDEDLPGTRRLVIKRNYRTAFVEPVTVPANTTVERIVPVRLPESGQTVVSVGDGHLAAIDVEPAPTPTGTSGPETPSPTRPESAEPTTETAGPQESSGAVGPGLGVLTAAVAAALAVVLARRR